MILCITPNAAVDRTLIVPGLRIDTIARPRDAITAAGGKGLNVARVLRALGDRPYCAGFLGGHTGQLAAELAAREGLNGTWTWIDGETRTCVILVDPDARTTTVINEAGPPVSAADWQRLIADAGRAAESAGWVCISGSTPPGSGPEPLADLIHALRRRDRPVWADTSGAALRVVLGARPDGIKINVEEAGELLGCALETIPVAACAAAELQARGIPQIVLTLGHDGALIVDAHGAWHAQPPRVEAVSAVGSGDALFAGLISALSSEIPPPEALRLGVACGTANALRIGGGAIDRVTVDRLLAETIVTPLPIDRAR